MSFRRLVQREAAQLEPRRSLGARAAAASAGTRGGIRARSSIRRPRRGSWFPRGRSRRCGRCGRSCNRRRSRRSRACDARYRRAQAPRRAGACSSARTRSTSAAVSAEVASSRIRMRGLRASALAISTIWRRDSGRSLTGVRGWMSVAPARASAASAISRWRSPIDQAEPLRRLVDEDVVGDAEFGDQRQFLKNAGDARGLRRRGRRERDVPALHRHAAAVRARRRRPSP